MPDRKFLESWIKRAGYSTRLVSSGYEMVFAAQYRDWRICAEIMDGWLLLRLYVFELPALSIERHSLFKICLEINDRIALSKFCVSNANELHLCAEYRASGLDAETFKQLVEVMLAQADEHYPALYFVAKSSATLERLGHAFRKT